MKKINRFLVAAGLLGALGATEVVSQEVPLPGIDNTAFGTTSAEFLTLGAGARGAALGGSFAAIADDISALYWNPAGAALITRPGVMVSSYDYVAETSYQWAGVAFPMSGGERVIGFQAGTFGFSDQPIYTLNNPDGDGSTYSVSESFFGFSYAQNFSDRFSAGLTAKYINDQLGKVSARGFALDLGTNFHAQIGERPIRASFIIQNLGSTLRHDGTGLDVRVTRAEPNLVDSRPQDPAVARLLANDFNLPTTFRVGLAYDFVNSASTRVTLLSEFLQPNNSDASAGGGMEWALMDLGQSGFSIVARGSYAYNPDNDLSPTGAAGFDTSLSSDENLDGLAFGGGLMYDRGVFHLGVDYAYKNLGLLGNTNFFSASINW
jgi:hypothetical protein